MPASSNARTSPVEHAGRDGGAKRADARTRTADPFITSEVLYQLSYVGGEVTGY